MIGIDLLVSDDPGGDVEGHAAGGLYHKAPEADNDAGHPSVAVLPSGGVTPLKLMVQSGLAGLHGGVVVALVVSILNAGALEGRRGSLWAVVTLIYTLASAIVWPVLYGALRFFASGTLRLAWLSLRYVVGFHAVNLGVVLASAWVTQSRYRAVLDPAARSRLITLCASLTVAWLWAAFILAVPRWRRSFWPAISVGLLSIASLAVVPLGGGGIRTGGLPRPHQGPVPARRLLLLNFDGADLDVVLPLLAEGKLPAFARLMEEGAHGRMRSLRPCLGPVTRTTLVTGKRPYRHAVRAAVVRSVGRAPIEIAPIGIGFEALLAPLVRTEPRSVADREVLALWEIASRMGGAGDAAGWAIDLDAGRAAVPPPVQAASLGRVSELLDADAARAEDRQARGRIEELTRALEADALVVGRFREWLSRGAGGVAAASFPGLDSIAHTFLRFARPEDFGDVTPAEAELYGAVLERYYRRMDSIVAEALSGAGEGTILVVTSSHGMDPAPLRRRLPALMLGRETPSGTHERGPHGFLFLRGPNIRAGRALGRASLVDVVPTALYAIGLPVARDMDGRILAGVFTSRYTFDHPVTVIRTYEGPPGGSASLARLR
ncbi:MAG: alkaline phosphatase family protein [Acidobacteriota bacterium]